MIRLSCPHCGWQNQEGSRFCGQCGRRLQLPEVKGPGAGLTVVTVLTVINSLAWLFGGVILGLVTLLLGSAGVVLSQLTSLLSLLSPQALRSAQLESMATQLETVAIGSQLFGYAFTAVGVIGLAAAIGLWQRREWGRILCIGIYALWIAFSTATALFGFFLGGIMRLALFDWAISVLMSALVIGYLFLPGVRASFTE